MFSQNIKIGDLRIIDGRKAKIVGGVFGEEVGMPNYWEWIYVNKWGSPISAKIGGTEGVWPLVEINE